mmetsp:Transcript_12575/g.45874  ORF Transcript_12575/g.45874 Transcript_12575/m.45874 type:complete len:128 (+) Transcript_12575:2888-3271(+)
MLRGKLFLKGSFNQLIDELQSRLDLCLYHWILELLLHFWSVEYWERGHSLGETVEIWSHFAVLSFCRTAAQTRVKLKSGSVAFAPVGQGLLPMRYSEIICRASLGAHCVGGSCSAIATRASSEGFQS